MKIVYVHTTDLSKNDTSETFVVNNAISLAEEGAETHLFVTNRASTPGLQLLKNKFGLDSFPPHFHLHDFQLNAKSNWNFYRSVVSVLKGEQFANAIIITRKHSILPHLAFARQPGQKLIFETHDFFYDLSIRKDIRKSSRRKQSIIEKLFFGKLDSIICLNKYQEQLYNNYVKVPLKMFPTGFRKQETNDNTKSNLLLYIGALEERKGIENLLNLAELLNDSYRIIITGSRNEQEVISLQNEINERKIQNRVEVREWLTKVELNALLKKAKIGLLPLKDGYFNEYLTVPLKYFDYAAFNLPVISSDFPSLAEYIRDGYNGFLVDWSDLSRVREIITEILEDEQKWIALSENQAKASENLTWKKRAIDQIGYFKELQ
ncbi:MAG: glycosyltransferase [Cyclobacteriaceae bacterium]